MSTFNAQYILSGSVRRQLDLLVNTQLQGALASFLGQTATVVGTANVDSVYARAGVSVDFTGSGASVDTLYLDGALSDYVITATASVVTLTRAA